MLLTAEALAAFVKRMFVAGIQLLALLAMVSFIESAFVLLRLSGSIRVLITASTLAILGKAVRNI